MVSPAGTGGGFGSTLTSTLTSTRSGEDDLDVGGFDPAESEDLYGGGGEGGVGGMLFQGHPSVDPKEEGGVGLYGMGFLYFPWYRVGACLVMLVRSLIDSLFDVSLQGHTRHPRYIVYHI